MAKRVIAFLLLYIIIMQAGGFLVSLRLIRHAAQLSARHQIITELRDGDLHVFRESQIADVKWTEEDEFRWNGAMFDVVRVGKESGDKIYYCYYDAGESLVMSILDDFREGSDEQNSLFSMFAGLLITMGAYYQEFYQISFSISQTQGDRIVHYRDLYRSLNYCPASPPPWQIA